MAISRILHRDEEEKITKHVWWISDMARKHLWTKNGKWQALPLDNDDHENLFDMFDINEAKGACMLLATQGIVALPFQAPDES